MPKIISGLPMRNSQVIDNCFFCTKEKVAWALSDLSYIRHNLSLCQECARYIDEKIKDVPQEALKVPITPILPPEEVYNPPNFQDKEPEERVIEQPKKEPMKYKLKPPTHNDSIREPGEEG